MSESGGPSAPPGVGGDGGSSEEFYELDPNDEEDPDGDSSDEESGSESSGHNSEQISTRSLSGSVLDYPMENGRRYCGWGEGSYFMPNDEAEQTRLGIVHQIHLALLDGELTAAPIKDDIGRILDVGTGIGEWAIAMAEKYPHAEVIGTDLSAIQPDQVPENVFFEIDDAEQEWTYTQSFDLIHMRDLSGSFEDWNYIYDQAFKHLRPGGYLEVRDFQLSQWMTEVPDSPSAKFARVLKSASDKAGRPIGVSHIKKNKARQAGFIDIQLGYLVLPLGPWPQDPKEKWIGKMWLIGVLEGLEATALRLFTTQKGWTPEDVRDLCNQVGEQLTSSADGSFSQVQSSDYVYSKNPLPITQERYLSTLIHQMSINMLPPISSLVPELLQRIDSCLSPPDQLFLRQANRTYIRDKLWAAEPLSFQDRIVYAVRKAFYARSGQRRSGCYSQDEIFCRGCMALRPAKRFDDKRRTFNGTLPVTTEEILQASSNRFCITCSLNLSPIDGTPEAYHSAQIISVAGRSLSRCLCCQKLQGKLLRTCFGRHHNYAIFKNGCPVCGVCESCYSNGPHNCESLLRAHRQSLSMLVHQHDYPATPVIHFTTDDAIAKTPEYQEGVHRLRYSFYRTDIFRKKMFRRYLYRPKGESDYVKPTRRTKSAR